MLVVVFVSFPLSQCAVEVSVANRNGALGEGENSFNCSLRYAFVRVWPTSTHCVAAECYTCGSRAPWPAGLGARSQNWHPTSIPVLKSRSLARPKRSPHYGSAPSCSSPDPLSARHPHRHGTHTGIPGPSGGWVAPFL